MALSQRHVSCERFTRKKVLGQPFQLPAGVCSNPLIFQHQYEVTINMTLTKGPTGMLNVKPEIQDDSILLLLMYRDSKVCTVCARTPEEIKLLKCSRCSLIFY